MADFVHELRAANPNARGSTDAQLIADFKERARTVNRTGVTSMRLQVADESGPVWRFINEQGFVVVDGATIGCGRNIDDSRDPDAPCCVACTNRTRVAHKRIIWRKQ